MHDQLKKRLIGGAVLVALAVIFLPMLLEEKSSLDQGFSDQPIPPKGMDGQGFQSRTLGLPGEGGNAMPGIEPLIEPPPVFIPSVDSAMPAPAPPPPAPMAEPATAETGRVAAPPVAAQVPQPETTPLPEPEPRVKPAPQPVAKAEPKPAPKPAPKPVPKPAPKPAAPKPQAPAAVAVADGDWVIQLASVTSEVRAEQLAVRLRAKDYPAFVESATLDGHTWYRVRIGPGQDRARMDGLLQRLQADPLVSGMDPKVISNR
jgi:DedD protein